MKLLVVGQPSEFAEFNEKFGNEHQITLSETLPSHELISASDIIFDFSLDQEPENFEVYAGMEGLNLFVNSPKISLAEMAYFQEEVKCNLFGFNGLPTFINRSILEVSFLDNRPKLEELCEALHTDYEIVEDRVGMVTPRVVCMIINEAFYTVQEGTASREDIDQGMKLGTNYPYGPFEWVKRMGISHVYEVLEAIYEDTKEERYKICPLLKREYLLS
ncbi:3-hydroxyacyl-CoA dehydrogenase family protein [Roseivirga sp. UBA838]|jgi:3-hydroxybutyryl-CoA dehydrogenase|uniref:3-hydroxyacyl-CoA dehydrogenase family protein n=1 Tax=Roseivirga sp. UBA838 TaxID=1947393 RepID=UPI00257FB5F1|nr:3-hydroxyacyl-CoA dehydrogenase family protein [Roseivirga sp. UBA838]|tara:strand:+ start:70190 stop:70843 length:654 start_codon:yes stop_codon:yes gene_type:complete